MAIAVVLRDGHLLVAPRPEGSDLAGLWEFPGGKLVPGETPAEAARRELHEETGLTCESWEPLVVVAHEAADRRLRLHAFLAREPREEPRAGWSWLTPEQLRALPLPGPNVAVLRALAWRMR